MQRPQAVERLRGAVGAFQRGDLAGAAQACADILKEQPRESAALHILGAVHLRNGDARSAITLLQKASGLDPANPDILTVLGTALAAAGNAADAIAAYRNSLNRRPAHSQTSYNLGNALRRQRDLPGAIDAYRAAIAANPNHPAALNNLGLCYQESEQHAEAMFAFERALQLDPAFHDARRNLAVTFQLSGRTDEALAQLNIVIAASPSDAQARLLRGACFSAQTRHADALADFDAARTLDPSNPDSHLDSGTALVQLGRHLDGVRAFEQALALNPASGGAWDQLGSAFKHLRRWEEAIAAFDRAGELDPVPTGRQGRALACIHAGRYEDAAAEYDRIVQRHPENRDAVFGRSVTALACGRFAAGWRDYLARPSRERAAHELGLTHEPLPQDLRGKRVLVHMDQGLGDEIFFLRFMPALRARGAAVTYHGEDRLFPLLARAEVADSFVTSVSPEASFDFRMLIGDLPFLLGAAEAPDPCPPPVRIPPLVDRAAELARRLADFGPPPYVGVTWRAGTASAGLLFKEIGPAQIAAALRGADARVIAVQRNPAPGEMAEFASALGRQVLDLTAANNDLETIHALVGLLDAYVAVSNTNVHLRASQGRPSRVVIPNPPEYRWMHTGDQSPWFPGTRIYRQHRNGDWSEALEKLAADLPE